MEGFILVCTSYQKMKLLLLCTLFFAAAWALPKGQDEPQFKRLYVDPSIKGLPKDILPRITNGEEVVPHSIPYQAYLIVSTADGSRWLCGGSLISPKHVLTAAHCLEDGVSVDVYLGAHNIQQSETSQVIVKSKTLIVHEDYDEDVISHDIGVIVFDDPVKTNENISAVALPSREATSDYFGANVRVSGWGRVSGDGDPSPVLLQANGTVIDNLLCRLIYSIVTDAHLCTMGDNGQGSCNGDSGGPLVTDNVQIGIVSFGAKGCPAVYPSAFTRVTSYLDWLEKNTGITV